MRISVVIPLFNKQATIQRALQSIFTQTVQPDEIIVVNDGSTDGSEKVVAAIHHPLVKLFYQSNSGVSSARNRGIDKSTGEWIAFLDADDEWLPDFIETIITLSFKYPQCSVLATAYRMQYPEICNYILLNRIPFKTRDGILTNYFQVASKSHPPLHSSSVVVKKTAIQKIGGFPLGVKSGEDLLTWARLAINYQIGYCLTPYSIFTVGSSNQILQRSERTYQEDKVGPELIKLLATVPVSIKEDFKKYVSHWYRMKASSHLRMNNTGKIWINAFKSLKYNPINLRIYAYLLVSILPFILKKSFMNKFN
jgi:glycosyltransferase involved in cell wall biosynthesis